MASIEIICEDCGQPRKTVYKNTKLCRECRLLRDVSYPHPTRTCAADGCGTIIMMIRRGDKYCGDHTYESQHEVECVFCKQKNFSILDELKVCSACARNPIYRALFIKALKKRQNDRREQNSLTG